MVFLFNRWFNDSPPRQWPFFGSCWEIFWKDGYFWLWDDGSRHLISIEEVVSEVVTAAISIVVACLLIFVSQETREQIDSMSFRRRFEGIFA